MKLEYTIVSVYDGRAWIITRPAGSTNNGTNAYVALTREAALRRIRRYRVTKVADSLGAPLTGEEVSREWNTYCEHHHWNQNPNDPRTWNWSTL